MDEIFFWESVGFICIYVMLALYIFFGLKFISDSRKHEKGSAQRAFFIGLGLFIISVAIGEGVYLSDLVSRFYTGGMNSGVRIFYRVKMWEVIAGYNIASIIDYDYYIIIFMSLLMSQSFLMKPLEKFMIRRDRPIVTYLNRILIPLPLLIRVLEVNLESWTGISLVEGSLFYYIFTGLWILVILVMAISIMMLMGLYLKMGIKSPKGSNLRRKSFLIIVGILFWVIGVLLTSTIFRDIERGDWYLFPIVPLLLVVPLKCMTFGFKREY